MRSTLVVAVLAVLATGCSGSAATPSPGHPAVVTIPQIQITPDPDARVLNAIATLQASVDQLGSRLDALSSDPDVSLRLDAIDKAIARIPTSSGPTMDQFAALRKAVDQLGSDHFSIGNQLRSMADALDSICSAVGRICVAGAR